MSIPADEDGQFHVGMALDLAHLLPACSYVAPEPEAFPVGCPVAYSAYPQTLLTCPTYAANADAYVYPAQSVGGYLGPGVLGAFAQSPTPYSPGYPPGQLATPTVCPYPYPSQYPTLQVTCEPWEGDVSSGDANVSLHVSPHGDQRHIDTALLSTDSRPSSTSSSGSRSRSGSRTPTPSRTRSTTVNPKFVSVPRIQTNEAELRDAEARLSLNLRTKHPRPAFQITPRPPDHPPSSPEAADSDCSFRPAKRARRRKPRSTARGDITLPALLAAYPFLATYPLFHSALAHDMTMSESAAPMIGTIRADPLDKCDQMQHFFHAGRRRIAQLDAFVARCTAEKPLSDAWRAAIVGVRRKLVERCENYKYNRRDILDRCGARNRGQLTAACLARTSGPPLKRTWSCGGRRPRE